MVERAVVSKREDIHVYLTVFDGGEAKCSYVCAHPDVRAYAMYNFITMSKTV